MLYLQLAALRLLETERQPRERGATLVEYALLVSLIFLVCISAVTLLGSSVSTQMSSVSGPLR